MRATRAGTVDRGMRRLPPLGPRGEGWVSIQVALELGILLVATVTNGAWGAPLDGAALLAGALLCIAGIGLFALGAVTLAGSFSIWVKPRPKARFVSHGPYRWMRHPVCTSQVLIGLGWALAWHSLVALVGVAVLVWYLDRLKLEREEQWLLVTFPAYEAYRREVPHRMLPYPPSRRRELPAPPRVGPASRG